jgi:hypothetical protein
MLLKLTNGHTERYVRVISDRFFVRLDAFHKLTFVPQFGPRDKSRLAKLIVLYRGVILEQLYSCGEIAGGIEAFNQTIDRLRPTKRLSIGGYALDTRVPKMVTHVEVRRQPPEIWIHFGAAVLQLPGKCGIAALAKLLNVFRDVPLVAVDGARAIAADVPVHAFLEMYLEHDGILPEAHYCPGIDECDHRWSRVRVQVGSDSYSFIVRDPDPYVDDLDAPYEASKHYAATARVAEQTERKIKAKQNEALETIRWGFARAIEVALPIDLAYEVARMLL